MSFCVRKQSWFIAKKHFISLAIYFRQCLNQMNTHLCSLNIVLILTRAAKITVLKCHLFFCCLAVRWSNWFVSTSFCPDCCNTFYQDFLSSHFKYHGIGLTWSLKLMKALRIQDHIRITMEKHNYYFWFTWKFIVMYIKLLFCIPNRNTIEENYI